MIVTGITKSKDNYNMHKCTKIANYDVGTVIQALNIKKLCYLKEWMNIIDNFRRKVIFV